MAHGSALRYTGDKQKLFPGVKLGDHTPEEVEALPPEWSAEDLVASGDFEWVSKEKVAARPAAAVTKPAETVTKPADGPQASTKPAEGNASA